MSKRRNALLTRYCNARGPAKGWHNPSGMDSSTNSSPSPAGGVNNAPNRKKKRKGQLKRSGSAQQTKPPKEVTHCPDCGCSVLVTRFSRHLLRCPKHSPAPQPTLPINPPREPPSRPAGVSPAPKKPASTREIIHLLPTNQPTGLATTPTANEKLKQDNLLRSWLQRQRKQLFRRLSQLPVKDGIEYTALRRLFEGRHIDIEQLIHRYLGSIGKPVAAILDGPILAGFRAYVSAMTGDEGLEQFPLRTGCALLTQDERRVLAAQRTAEDK